MSIYARIFVRELLRRTLKMSPKAPLQIVQEQAKTIKQTLAELKSKLQVMNQEYNEVYAKYLRDERKKLQLAVEEAQKKLVHLESSNGVPQIPIPSRDAARSKAVLTEKITVENGKLQEETGIVESEKLPIEKSKKEKKAKEPKAKAPVKPDLPVDVGRLDLRVAKIEDVQKHPGADTLYVLKINCGEEQPRTVCSGLVDYIPIEELRDRLVLLLCNLKPVKMRGITSEAMIMCATTPAKIEVLKPPENCQPGDLVHCDGYTRQPDDVMSQKKKIFETVKPDLHTNDNFEACYKGAVFSVPGKGNIVAKTLKNVPVT